VTGATAAARPIFVGSITARSPISRERGDYRGHLLRCSNRLVSAAIWEFRYGVNAPTLRIEGLTLAELTRARSRRVYWRRDATLLETTVA